MRIKTENRGRSFLPSHTSVLLRTPPLSLYLPLSLLPPAQESISTGSISWHEYSLPAESLVGERRRLRHRRRQWRRGEGWGRRREREMRGEMSPAEVDNNRGDRCLRTWTRTRRLHAISFQSRLDFPTHTTKPKFDLNSRCATVEDSVEPTNGDGGVCARCVKWVHGAERCRPPVHRHRAKWGGSARPSLNDMEDVKQRGERKQTKKDLTGVGAQSQRGLEAPGVEVRGSSLKHERHRQGNKHDLPSASRFDANNLTGVL